MFALHVFSVSALLVTTALFCCTGQLFVRAPPSASLRRGGNTACAQAVVLARLLGLMHVCFACICCCLCFLLPIRSRKSVPCCRFALCDMNLFMCFVLPSLLLSKSLVYVEWQSSAIFFWGRIYLPHRQLVRPGVFKLLNPNL